MVAVVKEKRKMRKLSVKDRKEWVVSQKRGIGIGKKNKNSMTQHCSKSQSCTD